MTEELKCSICLTGFERKDVEEAKYLPIYLAGSANIEICHDCEMALIEHIRRMRAIAIRHGTWLRLRNHGAK